MSISNLSIYERNESMYIRYAKIIIVKSIVSTYSDCMSNSIIYLSCVECSWYLVFIQLIKIALLVYHP